MKTTVLCLWTAVCVSALMSTTAFRASADDSTATTTVKQAPQPLKYHTGIVDAVDAKEQRLVLRNTMFTKTFTLGDSCAYTYLDKNAGTINGLHPGQQVTVGYQDAGGVLVARNVFQKPMRYEGTVKSIDTEKRVLVLNTGAVDRDLQLGNECKVALRDNKSGTLPDLRIGHHVAVTYETPNGKMVAREIAQTSDTFTGNLTAIDLTDRTLKAKSLFGMKKFNVSKGCTFVINGKADGELRDLKPGDKLVLSFDDVDGINVVNRIGLGEPTAPESATAQSQYQVP